MAHGAVFIETRDPEYDYLAKHFTEFQKSAQQLNNDANAYRNAVTGKFAVWNVLQVLQQNVLTLLCMCFGQLGILHHGQSFAETLLEVYQPVTAGQPMTAYADNQLVGGQASPQAIQAVEMYIAVMRQTHEMVSPELVSIPRRFVVAGAYHGMALG